MSPVLLLLGLGLAARGLGAFHLVVLHSWQEAWRWATGLSFLLMGLAHFTPLGSHVARLVPEWIPRPLAVVRVLGVWQMAGGLGLLLPGARRPAAALLLLLLLLKLPANLRAARLGLSLPGKLATPPGARGPAQLLWMGLVTWSGA